jgi:recombination protein RecT
MSQNNNDQQLALNSKMNVLGKFFEKDSVKQQLAVSLQDNADQFMASVIDLYAGDTYLQNCHPELVAMQAMKAAVLKLPVIKALGFAYIVPFKKDNQLIPQLQIGYKGLIQLAMRTGQYRIINADKVFEGELRTKNKTTGEYDFNGEATSEIVVGYFAHFEMLNGFKKTYYMTRGQVIEHAKKYSKSYNTANSPWKTEFDAMALKTVIRGLLSHWGYLSVEMQNAITEEDQDVAAQVLEEIQRKGNAKNMSFDTVDEADQVNDHGINGDINSNIPQGKQTAAPF